MSFRALPIQAISAGIVAAIVGFASSFAIVVQGLEATGATLAQTASGLAALSFAMGLCAVIASLYTRMPVTVAWSTPGAALLASTPRPDGGFAEAVGAFLICAALIVLAGFFRPLSRAVAAIPAPLANAMLAGVLFGLCLAPVQAVAEAPVSALAIIAVWVIAARFLRPYAVILAMVATLAITLMTVGPVSFDETSILSQPVLVMPVFTLESAISIALPLFVVTMASQNIPGIAVLRVYGYKPDSGPLFRITGLFSLLSAPFGGHAVNLAAITAAMCASEDAHPDPSKRYIAAAVNGLGYIVFALFAGSVMAFVAAAPSILIKAVAGLALLGSLAFSASEATKPPETREAAIITFLITASGTSFLGVSGAFWGLIAGGAFLALTTYRKRLG